MRTPVNFLFSVVAIVFCSSGAIAQDGAVCSLAPGPQARISEIRGRSGSHRAIVQIERGKHTYPVTSNCLIQGGDVVRPLPGSIVVVVMPSGALATADADHPLPIPVTPRPSRAASVFAVLTSFLGSDVSTARAMANTKEAQTRALDQPDNAQSIFIPGLLGAVRQNITIGHRLLLRWGGGTGPYLITLQTSGSLSVTTVTVADHDTELPSLPQGDYTLTVSCSGCAAVTVPLSVKADSTLPSTPEIRSLDSKDRPSVEAAWLLTQGPVEWRLEALSQLKYQARDHNDVVAQAIITPELN